MGILVAVYLYQSIMDVMNDTYGNLRGLVDGKQAQILSTNVDHCFQKTGFDKERLFYTQGYVLTEDGSVYLPEGAALKMEIPSELIPYCPVCGRPMAMNLRADNTFVEDEGWHRAAGRYQDFLNQHNEYLEGD